MKRAAGLLLAAPAVPGCDRAADPRAGVDPDVVQVDVGPQIRAIAEDTLTADEAAGQLESMGPGVIPALAAALEREAAVGVRSAVVRAVGGHEREGRGADPSPPVAHGDRV